MNGEGFLASQNGDLDAIKTLHPPVLRGVTFHGNTALHIAAREGHLHIVEWIVNNLKLGMCGRRNQHWNTPLHEAAKGGNPEVVRILLRCNKRCASKRNQFGETPLLIACQYGHLEAAKLLVEATPYYLIIWPSKNCQTCLHVAAYAGHLDIVKVLLGKPNGLSQYVVKLLLGFPNEILKYVFGPAFSNFLRFFDDSLLHRAVHGGHVEIVREILKSTPKWEKLMTERDEFGRCPVHVAVVLGRLNIIDEFLSSIPSCVEMVSEDNKTALHYAVEYNRFEVVRKLLFNRKEENAAIFVSCEPDISGNTALHLAAINGVNPQLVEYLLSFHGVRINALNNEGLTALDIAVSQLEKLPNCVRIVEILEGAGANGSCSTSHSNPNYEHQSKHYRKGRLMERKIVEVDTLVASLIATITFAAIFQIPGGIENDQNNIQFGAARLALDNVFRVFLFSDTFAMFSSLAVVVTWLLRERAELYSEGIEQLEFVSQLCLGFSIISTGIAFVSATILVVIPRNYQDLKIKDPESFKEYEMILNGVKNTAGYLPILLLFYLVGSWVLAYYVSATNKSRHRLKRQFRWALVYTLAIIVTVYLLMPSWGF